MPVVVGVFEPRRLSPIAEQLDKISDGYISALLRRGELERKPGQTLLLHHVAECTFRANSPYWLRQRT
ncbi:M17 family peptidase N-terminal domain-containing protein [Escherichia coli]